MRVVVRARIVNLGLLALSILSLGLVVWTAHVPTSLERQVRERHLLEVYRREDVQRIELRQGDRRTVVMRRPEARSPALLEEAEAGSAGGELAPGVEAGDEARWILTEPFETDADEAPVEQLLGSLQYATWQREVEGELPREGVAIAPARELLVEMPRARYRLRLGGDAVSPPGARYVEVSSDGGAPRTVVIAKRLVDELFVEVDSFRGRQIVPYRKGSIDRLVLSSAAGVRRLRRAGDDFRFDAMQEEQRVERQALARIFLALSRARAEPFVNVDSAKAAIASEGSIRVSIVPVAPDKPEASLEFGGRCPSAPERTLAIRHLPEPIAGCVDRNVLFALREPASELVDRGLFGFQADEVDTVRIVEGDSVLEFARGGEGFVLRQPRSVELDAEAAKDRLSRILDIEGDLLMGRDKPAGAPSWSAATVTIESSARPGEERSTETVRLSPPLADGGRRVYRESDGAVLVVSGEGALPLRADATLLADHVVFDYGIKDVRRVEVSNGAVAQTLERSADGVVTLVTPKGYDVDGGLATLLMDELRSLRALRWVSDRASTGFGLDKPRATVRLVLEVEGRELERTLAIGARAPGGYYASVDRNPGVFVAPRSLDRALDTWLINRAAFSVEPGSVVELSLEAQGLGSVQLRRVGGELTLQKGSSGFDPSRVAELLDALESLRPEAAVHLGPALASEGLRRPILSAVIRRQSLENVGMPPIRISVGSRDSFRDASVFYARESSVNATFALPRAQVQRLLDLF